MEQTAQCIKELKYALKDTLDFARAIDTNNVHMSKSFRGKQYRAAERILNKWWDKEF